LPIANLVAVSTRCKAEGLKIGNRQLAIANISGSFVVEMRLRWFAVVR